MGQNGREREDGHTAGVDLNIYLAGKGNVLHPEDSLFTRDLAWVLRVRMPFPACYWPRDFK